MFKQPRQLLLTEAPDNKVDPQRLVLGVSINGESKAYPIQFLAITIFRYCRRQNILVTYCTVCRTGLVLSPL
jgi:hypothetical protein